MLASKNSTVLAVLFLIICGKETSAERVESGCDDSRSIVADPCARVGELLSIFRHKAPVITARMERQHEHAVCIGIAHFTICGDRFDVRVIGASASHNEFTNPADGIWFGIRRLRRKAL